MKLNRNVTITSFRVAYLDLKFHAKIYGNLLHAQYCILYFYTSNVLEFEYWFDAYSHSNFVHARSGNSDSAFFYKLKMNGKNYQCKICILNVRFYHFLFSRLIDSNDPKNNNAFHMHNIEHLNTLCLNLLYGGPIFWRKQFCFINIFITLLSIT